MSLTLMLRWTGSTQLSSPLLPDPAAGTVAAVSGFPLAYVLTSPIGADWYCCSVECHLSVSAISPAAWTTTPRKLLPVFTLVECVHCAGCGKLLARSPGRCVWHPGTACPDTDLRLSVPLTRAARALMRVSGARPLPELAGTLLVEAANQVPDGRWQVWCERVWADRRVWLPDQE